MYGVGSQNSLLGFRQIPPGHKVSASHTLTRQYGLRSTHGITQLEMEVIVYRLPRLNYRIRCNNSAGVMLAMLAILMRHIGFVRSACYLKYFSLHFPLHSTLVGEWIGRDADRGTQEKKTLMSF